MRASIPPVATRLAVATLLACAGPVPGRAQTAPRDPHAHPHGPHQTLPPLPGDRAGTAPRTAPGTATTQPTIPAAPPPAPVLPPALEVPTRPPEPPPPPTVADTAEGAVTHTADGVRVTFGTGSADLNPDMAAALKALAGATPPDRTTYNLAAYAAGTPDDPSTARRLSLSRALAVRAEMIQAGVPSTRIYVRALGASVPPPPGVAPDRVDIAVTLAPPPPATPAAPASTAPPAPAAPAPGQTAPPQKAAP
ncbi:MAG TPA: OmpA family protein [Acetobacteraceae bacterium]|nr:OmpA family protein [Acetobacteraceae bacterium]